MWPQSSVTALVARQHGVISRAQLLALDIAARTIQNWRASGLLRDLHAGVFAWGHRAVSWHGRCVAALLAGGERRRSRTPRTFDFVWREQRLIVETDGPHHRTAQQRSVDRRAASEAEAHGCRLLRVPEEGFDQRSHVVARQIRTALESR